MGSCGVFDQFSFSLLFSYFFLKALTTGSTGLFLLVEEFDRGYLEMI